MEIDAKMWRQEVPTSSPALFYSWKGVASSEDAIEEALSDTVDLRSLAMVEGIDTSKKPPTPFVPIDPHVWQPGWIRAHVNASQEGIFLIPQNYHVFWTAYVDGQPASIYRANGKFMAVRIPSGDHMVELRCVDQNLTRAWTIIGGGLFLLLSPTFLVVLQSLLRPKVAPA